MTKALLKTFKKKIKLKNSILVFAVMTLTIQKISVNMKII